jgi:hypothetical protein
MDWQTLLVVDGQSIVIITGTVLGVAAITIYRTIVRQDIVDADKQRKRDERQRELAKDWTWASKQ